MAPPLSLWTHDSTSFSARDLRTIAAQTSPEKTQSDYALRVTMLIALGYLKGVK